MQIPDPLPEEDIVPESIEQTTTPLALIQEQLAACEDKYKRLLAESENGRKRMLKERQELLQYAQEEMLKEFLHPLDNLESALRFANQMSDEVKHWALGFQMIASQFRQVLADHGVEPFVSVGHPFDPHLHEAVEVVISEDHLPGIVIEECTVGYKKGDRPVRVARVKVAQAPEEKSVNQGETHV